jgi:hypothetical protein
MLQDRIRNSLLSGATRKKRPETLIFRKESVCHRLRPILFILLLAESNELNLRTCNRKRDARTFKSHRKAETSSGKS